MLLAAAGAAVVLVAAYQPWYAVSVLPVGTAAATQQQVSSVAREYGSPALQTAAKRIGSRASVAPGRPVATVSAHQALKRIGTAILLLAGVALLLALARLVGAIEGSGGGIAVLGLVAVGCVLFRILQPPDPAPGYVALSLSWGCWAALAGAIAVVVGGMRSPYSRV